MTIESGELSWLVSTDALLNFDLSYQDLRRLRKLDVKTRVLKSKQVLYLRDDLERATGKIPTLTKLSTQGAKLYCEQRWGVHPTSQLLKKNRDNGRIHSIAHGPGRHLHDITDLDKLFCSPRVIDGEYTDQHGVWVLSPTAAARCRANQETLSKWATSCCPIIGRKVAFQDRIVSVQFADRKWYRKSIRAYALADVEAIARVNDAALQLQSSRFIEEARGKAFDSLDEAFLTAQEVKRLYGWNNLSRDRKQFPLLNGAELHSTLQPRRTSRGTRMLRVFRKSDCDRARRIELAEDPPGLVRVTIAALRLGIHRAVIHSWNGVFHEATGKKLELQTHRARTSNHQTKQIAFLKAEDFEKLLMAYNGENIHAKGTTSAHAPIAELADKFNLPIHRLYVAMRKPHPAVGHVIEAEKRLAQICDRKANRPWKHRRKRYVLHLPVSDVEAIARYEGKISAQIDTQPDAYLPNEVHTGNGLPLKEADRERAKPRSVVGRKWEWRKLAELAVDIIPGWLEGIRVPTDKIEEVFANYEQFAGEPCDGDRKQTWPKAPKRVYQRKILNRAREVAKEKRHLLSR